MYATVSRQTSSLLVLSVGSISGAPLLGSTMDAPGILLTILYRDAVCWRPHSGHWRAIYLQIIFQENTPRSLCMFRLEPISQTGKRLATISSLFSWCLYSIPFAYCYSAFFSLFCPECEFLFHFIYLVSRWQFHFVRFGLILIFLCDSCFTIESVSCLVNFLPLYIYVF